MELESYLEGAAAIAAATRTQVLELICKTSAVVPDLDADPQQEVTHCLRQYLRAERVDRPLPPKRFRVHYCPLCFSNDLDRGWFPQFRRRWSAKFSTRCDLHRAPLFEWPYWTVGGDRNFPAAVVSRYFRRRTKDRLRAEPMERQLRRCRLACNWREDDPASIYWRQHRQMECSLMSDSCVSEALFGTDPRRMRRVIGDLSTFYCSNFLDQRAYPCGSQPTSFLGPDWLFSAIGRAEPRTMRTVCHLPRTTQKRAVLCISMRTVASLLLDPNIDAGDGRVLEYSETALTQDLKLAPLDASRWLKGRATAWPAYLRIAMGRSLGW